MKKQLFSFLIILTFVFSVSAQAKTKQSQPEKNLRKHVSYLASDALEGRRTGEKGGTFAAGYVANMFAKYKLKAGYFDKTKGKSKAGFLQPFDYVTGVEIGKNNRMRFLTNGNELKMENSINWLPLGYSPNSNISMTEIVFVGYGISSKRLKYDDYESLDVKNKIVAVFAGTPDSGNPHSPFGRFTIFAKANIAKQKGAKALVIIAKEKKLSNDKMARLEFDQTLGEMAIPTLVISRNIGQNLLDVKSEKELAEVEKWLDSKPTNAQVRFANLPKSTASINIDLRKKEGEAYNVIGIIEGRDPQLKNEAIIIGAHYDHLGRGGQGSLAPNSNEIHNGADDNASGTSAMLELARQFRKAKNNKRTLIFISFGAEESGLIGSKAYTENPVFPLDKTVAMINMDMVGRLRNKKLNVGGIGTAALWENLVNRKNNNFPIVNHIVKTSLNDSKSVAPTTKFKLSLNQDGFGPSDHSSFYAKKIPVLFFFTGTHSDYHKPSDDADKINYRGLEKITMFVSKIVKAVDQNLKRPVYRVAKSSAPRGGRRSFNVSLGTIPSYSDSDNTGLVLDGVRNGSAAEKAGIKGGDKIIKIADKEIRNISDYMFMLGEMKAGETYDVVVMRNGKKIMLKLVPDARK